MIEQDRVDEQRAQKQAPELERFPPVRAQRERKEQQRRAGGLLRPVGPVHPEPGMHVVHQRVPAQQRVLRLDGVPRPVLREQVGWRDHHEG